MPNVSYRFQALDAPSVVRAFGDVEAAARAAAAARVRASGNSSRTNPEAQKAREDARAARDKAREEARVAKSTQQAHDRTEREKTRSTEREVRARLKAEREAGKQLSDFYAKQAKQQDRDRRQQAAHVARENRRSFTLAARESIRQRRAHEGVMSRGRSEASSMGLGGFSAMGLAGGLIATTVGGGIGAVHAAGQLGGAAIRKRIGIEETATRLAIGSRGSGQRGVHASELIAEADATARSVKGSTSEDAIAGMAKYVQATGDLGAARRFSKTFATTAMATGASQEEIASTSSMLAQKFSITSEDQLRQALAVLIEQGKNSSFEMSDLAQYANEMGAAGARFGLDKGAGGIATLGGLAQIARSTTGSGAKASTAVQAMMRQIITKGGDGKEDIKSLAGGFDIWEKGHKGTKTKSIQDIIVGMVSGAQGDKTKLTKLMGDEGMAGLSAFATAYSDATLALKKGATETEKRAAGEKAIRDLLDKNIIVASNWSDVQKDAATAGNTLASTMTSASETILSSLGRALDPAVQAVAKNINMLVAPIASVSKGIQLMSQAFADVSRLLVSLNLIKAPKTNADLTGDEALAKYAANDAELAQLEQTEKKYGLTSEQAYRKGELQSERAGLMQKIGASGDYDWAYKQYVKDTEAANANVAYGTRFDPRTGQPIAGPGPKQEQVKSFEDWFKGSNSMAIASEQAKKDAEALKNRPDTKYTESAAGNKGWLSALFGTSGGAAITGAAATLDFANAQNEGKAEGAMAATVQRAAAEQLAEAAAELKAAGKTLATNQPASPPGSP